MNIKSGPTIERPGPDNLDVVSRQITQRVIYVYIVQSMQIIGIGANKGELSGEEMVSNW